MLLQTESCVIGLFTFHSNSNVDCFFYAAGPNNVKKKEKASEIFR